MLKGSTIRTFSLLPLKAIKLYEKVTKPNHHSQADMPKNTFSMEIQGKHIWTSKEEPTLHYTTQYDCLGIRNLHQEMSEICQTISASR